MSIEIDELNRLTKLFDSQNIGIHFHTIGSGTIEAVTNALEGAAEANGGKLNARHYPDHMGLPNKDQLERLTKVNGIIGFAPSFAFTTPGIHDSYKQYVGADRVARLQPLRWALDAGAIIGVGTDWAAVPQVPFPLMEGVVHRRNPYVGKDESEANSAALGITVEESIRAYTLGGAYAINREDRTGSLEVGKYADFIVLDQNLLEIDVDDISETQVLKTVFNGKVVFDRRAAVNDLDVVKIEITNPDLQNAVDAADLNLLVEDEVGGGGHGCFVHDHEIEPGARSAPDEVNTALASLADQGHRYARTARTVYWKNTDSTYWIQWTLKDDAAILWAYDPVDKKVVEVLQVRN